MTRTALIVVDMLVDFFGGKSDLPTPVHLKPLVAANQKACRAAREHGIPVLFSNDSFQKTEIPIDRHFKQSVPHCIIGTEGANLLKEMEFDEERDFLVPKKLYDGFYNTRLDSILRELDVKNVFITGTWTNACVKHTVMGAWCRGYNAVVIEDCVSCPEEAEHKHALAYMNKFYGTKTVSLDAWIASLKGLARVA